MTQFERLVFVALMERIRPSLAIEIGSRKGGSLQILDRLADRVISLDVDPTVATRLSQQYPKVEFITGDSKLMLPQLLTALRDQQTLPEFIFIDGDHTEEGARVDVHNALSLAPRKRCWVLVHDTFNPEVRKGVFANCLDNYPHLHYADLDFAPGILLSSGPLKGEIWGGFSLFILEPYQRNGAIASSCAWQALWERTIKNGDD